MKRHIKLFLVMTILLAMVACASSKYKIMYGVSDWYYTNHVTLQAQYDASNPEQQAWLKKNVNPYMNIMRQLVIAMKAVDEGNMAKASQCGSEILKIATGINYDASRMITAITAKDYDTILSESLALKTFIINKLTERR